MKHQTSGDSQRFSVEMEIANYQDMRLAQEGLLSLAQVRRTAIPALANYRATRMVLPRQVVADLGLPIHGTIGVIMRAAQRSSARRPPMSGCEFRIAMPW